jgi:voltage-gated potassium channel Kch
VALDSPVNWPDGTRLVVKVADLKTISPEDIGLVIIAGFGLAGRWVADIFDRHSIRYVIVEQNAATVATQRGLGRNVVQGDVSDPETLRAAEIDKASILCLTIPDEPAVLKAVETARALRPGIYIVARTNYSSAGMQAARLGADEVIKAEQAVARQFYEMLQRKLAVAPS